VAVHDVEQHAQPEPVRLVDQRLRVPRGSGARCENCLPFDMWGADAQAAALGGGALCRHAGKHAAARLPEPRAGATGASTLTQRLLKTLAGPPPPAR